MWPLLERRIEHRVQWQCHRTETKPLKYVGLLWAPVTAGVLWALQHFCLLRRAHAELRTRTWNAANEADAFDSGALQRDAARGHFRVGVCEGA